MSHPSPHPIPRSHAKSSNDTSAVSRDSPRFSNSLKSLPLYHKSVPTERSSSKRVHLDVNADVPQTVSAADPSSPPSKPEYLGRISRPFQIDQHLINFDREHPSSVPDTQDVEAYLSNILPHRAGLEPTFIYSNKSFRRNPDGGMISWNKLLAKTSETWPNRARSKTEGIAAVKGATVRVGDLELFYTNVRAPIPSYFDVSAMSAEEQAWFYTALYHPETHILAIGMIHRSLTLPHALDFRDEVLSIMFTQKFHRSIPATTYSHDGRMYPEKVITNAIHPGYPEHWPYYDFDESEREKQANGFHAQEAAQEWLSFQQAQRLAPKRDLLPPPVPTAKLKYTTNGERPSWGDDIDEPHFSPDLTYAEFKQEFQKWVEAWCRSG